MFTPHFIVSLEVFIFAVRFSGASANIKRYKWAGGEFAKNANNEREIANMREKWIVRIKSIFIRCLLKDLYFFLWLCSPSSLYIYYS
jgi:hypothetical protein